VTSTRSALFGIGERVGLELEASENLKAGDSSQAKISIKQNQTAFVKLSLQAGRNRRKWPFQVPFVSFYASPPLHAGGF
jgi:hypothetical protein